MKKAFIAGILALSLHQTGCSQTPIKPSINLDFEQHKNGFPSGWATFGDKEYDISVDSINKKNGKFSAVIENKTSKAGYKALSFDLPENYEGKSITLSGFIRTENVSEGYAGLWMRIDPQIGFDNMYKNGIKGTTDWTKYEITLPLKPSQTEKIIIGALLVGKGKMWIDGLKISIDGKDLDDPALKAYEKVLLPAQKDQAFDKGSQVVFPALNKELIANLDLLARVWGLMKYHHPAIAQGNYNWDYELFRFLPKYLEVKNKSERDSVLVKWIAKYGSTPPCKNCKPTPANAILKPDLAWIDKGDLSANLKMQLTELYNNRNQGNNYYIKLNPEVQHPDFTNERPYALMKYPDAGFRLLALYRYWNMIQYFFPNRHLTDKNWNAILSEYIPEFVNAKDELAYELAAVKVIGEVKDTHANLWGGKDKLNELRGTRFAPFKAEFVENKLVAVDYFNPEYAGIAKVKVGDVITHINGKPITAIVDSLKPYYPASNSAAMLRDISVDLLRSKKNSIPLTYVADGKTHQMEVPTYERQALKMYNWYKVDATQKSYKLLPENIGYITLANIKQEDVEEIKKSFKATKGIIIDIRNYPSTFVPFALGSYFVTKPTPFVNFTIGNVKNPGEFTLLEGPKIESDHNRYTGKLVVLVNENSQSQAEYTAMAFRAAEKTTVLGSTTAGADGNVSNIVLPGGLTTTISGIGIYYPNGKDTQRVGIVPDLIVKPTIKGIKAGKDELLERAIQVINK